MAESNANDGNDNDNQINNDEDSVIDKSIKTSEDDSRDKCNFDEVLTPQSQQDSISPSPTSPKRFLYDKAHIEYMSNFHAQPIPYPYTYSYRPLTPDSPNNPGIVKYNDSLHKIKEETESDHEQRESQSRLEFKESTIVCRPWENNVWFDIAKKEPVTCTSKRYSPASVATATDSYYYNPTSSLSPQTSDYDYNNSTSLSPQATANNYDYDNQTLLYTQTTANNYDNNVYWNNNCPINYSENTLPINYSQNKLSKDTCV